MKYKIKNKTEAFIKYAKVLFAPKEEKILELNELYKNGNFDIEKLEKPEKKNK